MYSCETNQLAINEVEDYEPSAETPVAATRHEPRADSIAEESDGSEDELHFVKPAVGDCPVEDTSMK